MSDSLYESGPRIGKREWIAIAALVALCAVCFFALLGGVPLLGKDEPRYAQVAREMYESGDWITPRLAGHVWFEKPALPYWMMAAAYAVFGTNEFAARFGSALLATASVFLVYAIGRRAGGPRQAVISAAILVSSALWFAFARGAGFDMPLAATITGALAAFFFYDIDESDRRRLAWSAAAGLWTGASMLAKGLAGPLLLTLVVVAYLVVTGGWRRVRLLHVAAALAATAAVAAVWYVPVYARNGWPFIEEFFVNHHFRRYLTNKYHHPQPVYFYLLIVIGGLLPWTFLIVARLKELAATLWRRAANPGDRMVVLAAVWVVVPVVFFSASTSKLPGYILPVFPGLALLAGWSVDRIIESGRGRWALFGTGATVAGLGIGFSVYAARALSAPRSEILAIAIPLAVAGGCVVLAAARGRVEQAVWIGSAGMACAVLLIATFLFAELANRESLADLSRSAGAALTPGEQVVLFGVVEYTPVFYVDGRMAVDETGEVLVADSYAQLDAAIGESPTSSVLCITDERRAADLSAHGEYRVQRIAAQRDRVLLRVATSSQASLRSGPARLEPLFAEAA